MLHEFGSSAFPGLWESPQGFMKPGMSSVLSCYDVQTIKMLGIVPIDLLVLYVHMTPGSGEGNKY